MKGPNRSDEVGVRGRGRGRGQGLGQHPATMKVHCTMEFDQIAQGLSAACTAGAAGGATVALGNACSGAHAGQEQAVASSCTAADRDGGCDGMAVDTNAAIAHAVPALRQPPSRSGRPTMPSTACLHLAQVLARCPATRLRLTCKPGVVTSRMAALTTAASPDVQPQPLSRNCGRGGRAASEPCTPMCISGQRAVSCEPATSLRGLNQGALPAPLPLPQRSSISRWAGPPAGSPPSS